MLEAGRSRCELRWPHLWEPWVHEIKKRHGVEFGFINENEVKTTCRQRDCFKGIVHPQVDYLVEYGFAKGS